MSEGHGKIHGINARDLRDHVKAHGSAHYAPHAHGGGGHGPGPRQFHHMYVPIGQRGGNMKEGGKEVPVHTMHVKTRSKFLSELLDSSFRGGLGTAYRFYFWAVVAFILMVFFYNINLYVSAAFAFLTGLFWSQRLIEPPWNVTWFKGKALYYAK
ncbi:hypothetical protein HY572_04180 [Candidatus Micrarchaeota archaeon]|nr:hypothetical protein [Candidatus Micrarchaeota archaeon]